MAKETKKTLRNKVIYSIFIRNYSPAGTFTEVKRDLGRIRGLGVDIIWFLPIYPIGEQARIGQLGSPYAIQDYRKVNPEYGTMDEFKSLVAAIHDHGMKCVIDIVFNHTSPDSWLANNHHDYFYKTEKGEMINRNEEWKDIVDLDYGNERLWDYQVETLKMWVAIVDGFRCDVAPLLPLDFWLRAREEVAALKPDFIWLAESVEPEFIIKNRARGMISLSDSELYQAFDICYDYDTFHYFRDYLEGRNTLEAYVERVKMQQYIYPDNYVKLRYLENHDQARAKAVIPELNDLVNWTSFMYFQKGTTLVYAGQEYGSEFRPDLFNHDPVNWHTGLDLTWLFQVLLTVKKMPIVAYGSYMLRACNNHDLIVATYTWNQQVLLGVFSLKSRAVEVEVNMVDGSYKNLIDQQSVKVKERKLFCNKSPIIVEYFKKERVE